MSFDINYMNEEIKTECQTAAPAAAGGEESEKLSVEDRALVTVTAEREDNVD